MSVNGFNAQFRRSTFSHNYFDCRCAHCGSRHVEKRPARDWQTHFESACGCVVLVQWFDPSSGRPALSAVAVAEPAAAGQGG
jgi:hypothetical protein